VKDYAAVLNIVYDDAAMREARAACSAAFPCPRPRPRARCAPFALCGHRAGGGRHRTARGHADGEYKYERMRVLAADVDYRLVREEGEVKLDRKVVRLVNCDDFLHGLGYLL
jgi:hypothetical protein